MFPNPYHNMETIGRKTMETALRIRVIFHSDAAQQRRTKKHFFSQFPVGMFGLQMFRQSARRFDSVFTVVLFLLPLEDV